MKHSCCGCILYDTMDKYTKNLDPLGDSQNGHILTRAIIDTIREPLLILGADLHVIAASRAFHLKFGSSDKIHGLKFYNLNNGVWNIPKLNSLLEKIITKNTTIEEYEIENVFPGLGKRIMIINAREVAYKNDQRKILLSILDVTEQRALELEKDRLVAQKDLLLKEMRHRIANSLQLIASILILKVGMIESAETRSHLKDAHERIMSIANVQRQLNPGALGENIVVVKYLKDLCASLARSMIGGRESLLQLM